MTKFVNFVKNTITVKKCRTNKNINKVVSDKNLEASDDKYYIIDSIVRMEKENRLKMLLEIC